MDHITQHFNGVMQPKWYKEMFMKLGLLGGIEDRLNHITLLTE